MNNLGHYYQFIEKDYEKNERFVYKFWFINFFK